MKIAVLGSAVSSIRFAPYNEPDWEIWSCSPANRNIPKCDVWFELHNPELKYREGLAEWMEWLKKQPKVYMQQALPEYTGSIEYPLKDMIAKYGRYWWTSQISYMLALAIEQKPEVIGIYGVDMAANAEYSQQRAGCYYFIEKIQQAGIQLVVPPESDLIEPPPLYGYCESSRMWRKFYARRQELEGRIGTLNQELAAKEGEKRHLVGAIDDLEYVTAHWANRTDFY